MFPVATIVIYMIMFVILKREDTHSFVMHALFVAGEM
jgi:hypothetical protein